MNFLSPHLAFPRWVAFWLRLAQKVVFLAAFLALLLVVLELIAFFLLPGRSTRYLVKGEVARQPAWVDNQFFPYRFFPARMARPPLPVVALNGPSESTLRVALLGGSTAMGMPDPAFGLGRQLEVMLQRRYPDATVEIIHMAIEGGNSHVLREAARDLRRIRPHAVIVLTGNDEVVGPYGPASGLGQWHHSTRLARWMAIFSRTRLSQLLVAGINRMFPARMDLNAWRMQEPISLRGRMAPDDPRLKTVYRSYRKNLAAILKEASRASPVVIVCTVPVNLRDCAPFSTSFVEDEIIAQEVRETLRAASAAEAAGNAFEAIRLYSEAIRRDPTHAEALFRAARLALQENRTAEAAALFSRARDADALRLRADSQLNAIIRECARDTTASLLDAETLFALRSPQGIPGREFFLNHIHFTFEGHHLLAAALLHRMEFLRAFQAEPAARIPGPDAIAGDLLYHPWGRVSQLATVIRQQLPPPFRRQLTNAETLARLNEELRRAEERLAAFSPENTQAIFARRQASRPHDAWLASMAARHLLQAGDPFRAEAAAQAAQARWPHRYDSRALLALTRAALGQEIDRGIALLSPPGEDSGYHDIYWAIHIGRRLIERKQFEQARPWLEYALQRDAWNSEATILLAEVHYQLDQGAEATELLKTAIKRNPRNPLLWEELAVLYTLLGDWNIANECFAKSEELAPYRYERLLKWAEALVRLRQYGRANRHITRYLSIIPEDPEALALQAQIQQHLPTRPEVAPEPPASRPARRFPWE